MDNEKKIGEKFLYGRKRLHLVVLEKEGCKECFLKDGSYSDCCKAMKHIGPCESNMRNDGKHNATRKNGAPPSKRKDEGAGSGQFHAKREGKGNDASNIVFNAGRGKL